eukprot:g4699.t1
MARLIPPVNFGMVEENLYRSGVPTEINLPFLERLHLKKVIYLAQDEPDDIFDTFVREYSIEMVQLGSAGRTKAPNLMVTEETVLGALQHMLDPRSYPLLICCHLGRTRTGSVVGCLRKLQRWHLSSIYEEFRRYCGGKVRLKNEQFIELFDTDLVPVGVDRPASLGILAADDDGRRLYPEGGGDRGGAWGSKNLHAAAAEAVAKEQPRLQREHQQQQVEIEQQREREQAQGPVVAAATEPGRAPPDNTTVKTMDLKIEIV